MLKNQTATGPDGMREQGNYSELELQMLEQVRQEVLRRLPNGESAEEFFAGAVRRAMDEVLNLHEERYDIDQLDAPEQTYIGTRTEVLIRDGLDVGVGTRADTLIAGHEVDLKWSRRQNWMIGPENLGTVCLGVGTDSAMEFVSAGLFIPTKVRLGAQNRDRKFTAGATYRAEFVRWIVRDVPLPANFIATLPEAIRKDIMSQGSAQARMRKFAELVPYTPVPRSALRYVSLNKDDFMRRVRRDSSRAEPPLGEMVCLSWKYAKLEASRLGFELGRDEFVFVRRTDLDGGEVAAV